MHLNTLNLYYTLKLFKVNNYNNLHQMLSELSDGFQIVKFCVILFTHYVVFCKIIFRWVIRNLLTIDT